MLLQCKGKGLSTRVLHLKGRLKRVLNGCIAAEDHGALHVTF